MCVEDEKLWRCFWLIDRRVNGCVEAEIAREREREARSSREVLE